MQTAYSYVDEQCWMRLTIEEVNIILIGYNYGIILLHITTVFHRLCWFLRILCLGEGDGGWVWGLWHSNLLRVVLIHFQAHLTDRYLTNKSASYSCPAENDPLYMTVVTW